MTVGSLKKMLEGLDDNMVVCERCPDHFTDKQEKHMNEARCVVYGGGNLWFETYGEEAIDDEIDAIVEMATEQCWTDEEFIDCLLAKDEHGYTLDDIEKNAEPSVYYFVRDNEYRKEMYPDA